MIPFLAFVSGLAAFMVGSWILEILPSRGLSQMPFSRDERVALGKVDQLLHDFAKRGLPHWGRREVWRWIAWIWKATRATAVRSGRLPAALWLLGFASLCLLCAAKTLAVPQSHDLRFLLAGNDFVTFFAGHRHRP